MVKVINTFKNENGFAVEYQIDGLSDPISTIVPKAENLTPYEIAHNGLDILMPHLDIEFSRLGIIPDYTMEEIYDKVSTIEILGISNMNFSEGQPYIDQPLRCTGHTKFAQVVDLRDLAEFSLLEAKNGISINGNIIRINPTNSCTVTVVAEYDGVTDQRSFDISYSTLADIEERNRIAREQAEKQRLADLENTRSNKIAELQTACNQDILNGFTCHIKDEDRIFGFELDDQLNLTGQLTMFNADPTLTSVYLKCKGLQGLLDTYTKDEFIWICTSADNTKREKINRFWALKQAVLVADTIEDVNDVSW